MVGHLVGVRDLVVGVENPDIWCQKYCQGKKNLFNHCSIVSVSVSPLISMNSYGGK